MSVRRLDREHTALLVVDLQGKVLRLMRGQDMVVRRAGRLMDAFETLGLPVFLTEHYRRSLGVTVPEIDRRVEKEELKVQKTRFSAWVPEVRALLEQAEAKCVVLCGLQTHVAVAQTALDLLEAGYMVAVTFDASSARHPTDHATAVERLTQAGVVPMTCESVITELVEDAASPAFRDILNHMD